MTIDNIKADISNMKAPRFKVPNTTPRLVIVKVAKPKSKGNRANMTAVLGRHYVPTILYIALMVHMDTRMSNIKAGELYTLSEMSGNEFWADLKSSWMRNQAGRAFAHMVSMGIFPFEFVQYKKYSTKRYLLK